MRKKLIIKSRLILLIVIWIFSSCTTDLDVEPSSDIPAERALNDPRAIENAIVSAYGSMKSQHCLGGSMIAWPFIMSDLAQKNETRRSPDDEFYNRNIQPSNPLILETWSDAYDAINRCNNVIDVIESGKVTGFSTDSVNSPFATPEENKSIGIDAKKRILGEAYFIRGVMFFELVRLFAPQYAPQNLNEPGIPLRTKPVKNRSPVKRSSVKAVYQQVISDLKRSSDLLPEKYDKGVDQFGNPFLGRAVADAAQAYLAKVYFQQGKSGYDKVLPYIEKVIGTEPGQSIAPTAPQSGAGTAYNLSNPGSIVSLYDISRYGVGQAYERIFYIRNQSVPEDLKDKNVLSNTNSRLVNKVGGNSALKRFPDYFLSSTFIKRTYNDYSDNKVNNFFNRFDKRILDRENQEPIIKSDSLNNDEVVYSQKYFEKDLSVSVIRASELVLMRAELNAMNGNLDKAIKDILYMVKNRLTSEGNNNSEFYKNYLENLNRDQLIEEIRRERKRELHAEGYRLHYLRRRWSENASITAGDRGTASLNWNDERLVLPIPRKELLNNDKAVQNKGY